MMRCDFCGTVIERGVCPYCGMREDSPGEAGYVPEILDVGFEALRTGDFCGAWRYFDRVARVEPENGRALLGKLMAAGEAHTESELAEIIRGNTQRDNEIFTCLLRKAVEIAPGEMREVFSDEYYDAKALMRAGKYNEALRILRAIEDYHSDAPDMAGECLRHLAGDIVRKLKPSMTNDSKNVELDPEIDALREECRVMIERYIEAMYTRSQSTPAEEYIFAMNASQLVKCVDRLNAEGKLTGVKRLRLLNDTRAILRKTGEFLERNAPAAQDESIPAVNDSIITAQGEALPDMNDSTTTAQDVSLQAMNDSHTLTQDASLPDINDNNTAKQDDLISALNDGSTDTTQDASLTAANDSNAMQDYALPITNDYTATATQNDNAPIQDEPIPTVNDNAATTQDDSILAMNEYNATTHEPFPDINDSPATTHEPMPAKNDSTDPTQNDAVQAINDSTAITQDVSLSAMHDNTPTQDDSLPATNNSNAAITHNNSIPAINDSTEPTQNDATQTMNDSTATVQDASSLTINDNAATNESLPATNDNAPTQTDNPKIPGWLKIALITAGLVGLAFILSLIASLL